MANEALVKKCGKTVVRKCSKRWNRLLDIRIEVNQALEELEENTSHGTWAKLENLVKLLECFAVHTEQLQVVFLTGMVPCMLNLEAHLLTTTTTAAAAAGKSLREHIAAFLHPDSPQFDATPAADCKLDLNVPMIPQKQDIGPL